MQRYKRIYLLLGVLALACAATFAVVRWEQYQEKISTSGAVVLEVSVQSVDSLAWEYEDTSLSFHKEDTWLYDGDEAFPVDGEKLESMLARFESFTAAFQIEEVEDYGQYGLDDPLCTITFTAGGQSYEILLGDYSTMDAQRYVSIGDGNVYLAEEDPLDDFDAVLSDVIDHDTFPDFDRVEQVSFSGAEDYSLFYQAYEEGSELTCCPEDVYYARLDGESLPLDTGRVDSYLNTVIGLDLTDYVTYNATDGELAACGLDDPELMITVDYTARDEEDGEQTVSGSFTLSVSRDPEERAAAEEAAQAAGGEESTQEDAEEEITAYARMGDSQIVYQISGEDYEALMAASYDSLRHLEVLTAPFADITRLDFTLEGKDYTITAQEDGGELLYFYQEEELDISALQSAVENLLSDSFTDEQPSQQEEIRFTAYLDNENFPQVEVALYRYDGSLCLAQVDGRTVCLVPRSAVVDLIEAVHAVVLN